MRSGLERTHSNLIHSTGSRTNRSLELLVFRGTHMKAGGYYNPYTSSCSHSTLRDSKKIQASNQRSIQRSLLASGDQEQVPWEAL